MNSFKDFWDLVVDVWRHGLYGVDIGQILIALAIFVAFLVFRRLFARFVLARVNAWTARTSTRLDDEVARGPGAAADLRTGRDGLLLRDRLYPAQRAVRRASSRTSTARWSPSPSSGASTPSSVPCRGSPAGSRHILTPSMVQWLIKAFKIGILLIGGAVILEIWGIQVGPLIAGLGLFGVAVALGAQDLFKNLIAGLFVIGERRFNIGDWIHVDGVVEGIVEFIGFRTTRIRRFDKAPVFVPNSKLSDNAVTNFSHMTHRRIYWTIGARIPHDPRSAPPDPRRDRGLCHHQRGFRQARGSLDLRTHRQIRGLLDRHHAVLLHPLDRCGANGWRSRRGSPARSSASSRRRAPASPSRASRSMSSPCRKPRKCPTRSPQAFIPPKEA